jgi:tetratricopeptide (TPR) repeat protein
LPNLCNPSAVYIGATSISPPKLEAAMQRILLVGFILVGSATNAGAQFPPDSLVNLEFFDKDIRVRELIGQMRGFSFALGVRCQFCHVGEEGQPLSEFDFPSDEKRTKRTARIMLQMVATINESHLPDIPDRTEPHTEVSCATCHRGLSRPRMLEDVLAETLESDGLEATVAQYRELREEYYGSGSYDFGEFVLTEWAQVLARSGQADEAIGVLELNAEMFPESGTVRFMVGEVFRLVDDTVQAKVHYDRAIELEPRIQRQVDRALGLMRGGR